LDRGGCAIVLRDSIGFGTFFTCYEVTKHILSKRLDHYYGGSAASILAAGGLAGVAYRTVSYPFDLAKTAVRMNQHSSKSYIGAGNSI
jgi:hypothetical protein